MSGGRPSTPAAIVALSEYNRLCSDKKKFVSAKHIRVRYDPGHRSNSACCA